MTTITANYLRDLAHIQHTRSLGEKPLHETPAWLAAERIEALEEQLAEVEIQTAQLSARLVESDVERDKLAVQLESGRQIAKEWIENEQTTTATWQLARRIGKWALDTPPISLAQHDAAVRREFAEAIWAEMLKHQKVIKVLPLTMAKDWDEASPGGAA